MRVTRAVARKISQIEIDQDIDFGDTYQVGSLHTPAADEALRKGNQDIADAEISDTAAIAYAKLALEGKIDNADIKAAAGIVLSKIVNTYLLPTIMTDRGDMVYRGASFPGRIPAGTEGYFLTMGANDPGWAALPLLVASQTVNYDDSSPVTIVTLPAGSVVLTVMTNTTTPWVGTTPKLDVGDATSGEGYMTDANTDVTNAGWHPATGSDVGTYIGDPKIRKPILASTAVIATIEGTGLSAGVTVVYIIYVTCA